MKERFIKYRFLVVLAILISSIYVVSSLLNALLISIMLAYNIRPVAEKVEHYTKVRDTAAFIAIFIVVTPITVGFIIAGYQMSHELSVLSDQIDELSKKMNEVEIVAFFSQYTDAVNVEYTLTQLKNAALNFAKSLPERALSLPHYLIEILLIPFVIFYLLIERHHIYNNILILSSDSLWKKLIDKIDEIFYGIFMGHFLVAIIAGIIATIGFLILGIPYAFFLGFIAMIAAFLPIVGASTVAFALCVIYILTGDYAKAVEIFVFSVIFLVIFIDFVVRPRVVSATTRIHPMLVVLGFTGGPFTFGVSGFVLGPVILGIAKAVVDVLREEMELRKIKQGEEKT